MGTGRFFIFPFGFYTTETSVGLGLFSQYTINEENRIFGNSVFTFKKQFMFVVLTDLNKNKFSFHNYFKIKDYYSEFYGYGNDTENTDPVKYKFFQIDNTIEFGKKISETVSFHGAVNNFLHIPNDHKDILGYNSYGGGEFYNGVGFSSELKNVSDKFFRDGFNIKATALFYPEFIGNSKQFLTVDLEGGFFKSINNSAFNTLITLRSTAGKVHPEKLSRIGGTKVLRGYPDNRFVDYNLAAVQTQYDFRIYKKLSGCAFIGFADVFESPDEITKVKTAFGAGLIYEHKDLILRFEAATSPEKDIEIIITGNRAY